MNDRPAFERREQYAAAIRDRIKECTVPSPIPGQPPTFGATEHDIADTAIRLADAEQAELRRERDLAIAHDRQPYPTAWAYEQACKALRRKEAVIERVRQMTNYWEQQLPEVIRTPAVVSALRAALEAADDPSRLAAEAPCCSDPTCTCNQVNAAGRCDCAKWDSAPAAEAPEPATQARRGDAFEQWLKAQRDAHGWQGSNSRTLYDAFDGALDTYRLHADTGTPLNEHVCEGRVAGDCECLDQPAAVPAVGQTVCKCPVGVCGCGHHAVGQTDEEA